MPISCRITMARKQIKGKGAANVYPITGHEGPEVE
jgi:hypothetical protein